MKVYTAAITDAGKVRANNEDNFLVNGIYKQDTNLQAFSYRDATQKDVHVFAVCDGMGGESLGELASKETVKILGALEAPSVYKKLELMMQKANEKICQMIRKNAGRRIGTTASVLVIRNGFCSICHIGDSRIYRLREGNLVQLTKDHTRLQQMIDAGIIKKEDAGKSQHKHVLTQHLGIFPQEFIIEPQLIQNLPVQGGDVFLICSDGLTDMVSDHEIREIIIPCQEQNIGKIAETLVAEALSKGGKDNITAILALYK